MSGDCDLCGSYDHVETKCDADQPQDPTEPRMVIQAVPASVPRSRVVAMLADLGIDAMKVERGGVWISGEAIRCRVLAEDVDGNVILTDDRDIAWHEVCIPIMEDRP